MNPNELPKVNFAGEKCTMQFLQYQNKRTAIQLWSESGPMARATVNLEGAEPAKDHIFVKNYSENEGMAQALVEAGLGEIVADGDFTYMKVTHPAALAKMAEMAGPTPAMQAAKAEQAARANRTAWKEALFGPV